MEAQAFSLAVLQWFDRHGRKKLPWQKPRTAYRVWLSEIMLQQTQVNTVIAYFQRFCLHFPDLASLAAADIDEVLALWSGLGYYARARNLHRTAQIIQQQYAGNFPSELAALQQLPGIGRSTAGAILALSMNKHATILDGNVKRVLCRYHAVEGWPDSPQTNKQLWTLAEHYTPAKRIAAYTQAMMDLGALICTRSQPKCNVCPLQATCSAYKQGNPSAYPHAKPRKTLPIRATKMILLCNENFEVLLERRPPVGIWGGLWSLPEYQIDNGDLTTTDASPLSKQQINNLKRWCRKNYYCQNHSMQTWPVFRHTFSHFHLDITPILIHITHWNPPAMEPNGIIWYNLAHQPSRGLATPIKRLLTQLKQQLL